MFGGAITAVATEFIQYRCSLETPTNTIWNSSLNRILLQNQPIFLENGRPVSNCFLKIGGTGVTLLSDYASQFKG